MCDATVVGEKHAESISFSTCCYCFICRSRHLASPTSLNAIVYHTPFPNSNKFHTSTSIFSIQELPELRTCTEVFQQRFTRKTSISPIQSALLINSYIGYKPTNEQINNCEIWSSQWQCYSSNYYHCFGEICFHYLQDTIQSYLLTHHIHTPLFSHSDIITPHTKKYKSL